MAAIRREELARLSGSKEYENYILRARTRFEEGRAATVRELRKVYRRAAESIRQDILRLTPGTLRHAHLSALATNLERRARELNQRVLDLAHKGIYLSVDAGTQAARDIAGDLLQDAWPKAEVARLFAPINERAALALLSRTGKDGLKLSDRVWRIGERYRNAVQRLVEDGVVRGLDSRKLARQVQQYLEPGKWHAMKLETRRRLGVSKDVSYEAMRLARTEMNNAYHEASIMANRANPGYRGVYWRLSTSHAVPDKCDDLAVEMKFGEQGFYPKGEEPTRPHPQCMCTVIPAYEDAAEFADRLNEWMRDPSSQPAIERWYRDTGQTVLPRSGGGFPKALSDSLRQTLRTAEDEIVGRSTEKAYLIDRSGGVILAKEGDRSSVTFSSKELALFPGNVLTHNHPSGSSFSWPDISLAINHQLSEVRAVGAVYQYSARPKSGGSWPGLAETGAITEKTANKVYQQMLDRVITGKMSMGELNRVFWHRVWTSVSKQAGFTYTRRKR